MREGGTTLTPTSLINVGSNKIDGEALKVRVSTHWERIVFVMFDDEGGTAQQTIARARQDRNHKKSRPKDRVIIQVSAVSISRRTNISAVSIASLSQILTHLYLQREESNGREISGGGKGREKNKGRMQHR